MGGAAVTGAQQGEEDIGSSGLCEGDATKPDTHK